MAEDEKWKRYRRGWNGRNPRSLLNAHYKHRYGISLEDYEALHDLQKGLCAICLQPERVKKRLSVDHCHTTTTVRGLLCDNCNKVLGLMADDANRMERAASYLRGFPCLST